MQDAHEVREFRRVLFRSRVVAARIVVELDPAFVGGKIIGAQPVLTQHDRIGGNRAHPFDEAREMECDLRIGRAIIDVSGRNGLRRRSEEHTSELQSLMRISYAVFWLKKKKKAQFNKLKIQVMSIGIITI